MTNTNELNICLTKTKTTAEFVNAPELILVTMPRTVLEKIPAWIYLMGIEQIEQVSISQGLTFSCLSEDEFDLWDQENDITYRGKKYVEANLEETLGDIHLLVANTGELTFSFPFEFTPDRHYQSIQSVEELLTMQAE